MTKDASKIEPLDVQVPRAESLRFETPDALTQWNGAEAQKWRWVRDVYPSMTRAIGSNHEAFFNALNQAANEWRNNAVSSPEYAKAARQSVQNAFTQYYGPPLILSSEEPAGIFIEQLRKDRGEPVAAGAYAYLVNKQRDPGHFPNPKFFEGLLTGFLFERDVDWSAKAHQEALARLKSKYGGNISQQEARAKEIERQNSELNAQFSNELTEKSASLIQLHVEQSEAFKALVERYDAELKNIETTYDQKLALQKPVTYWETKEKFHGKMSKRFGAVALCSAIALVSGLALLIHWVFGGLASGEDPRHWQVGVLAAGVFFVVWFLRILLRLFFSHVHLSSDAAERRTMILTYLALSREGADVAPDDRKLILQHLFRTASDGLVKDDAAPPGIWELITRSR